MKTRCEDNEMRINFNHVCYYVEFMERNSMCITILFASAYDIEFKLCLFIAVELLYFQERKKRESFASGLKF